MDCWAAGAAFFEFFRAFVKTLLKSVRQHAPNPSKSVESVFLSQALKRRRMFFDTLVGVKTIAGKGVKKGMPAVKALRIEVI